MSQDSRGGQRIWNILSHLKPLQLIRAWNDCAGPALLKQVRFLGLLQEDGLVWLRLEVPDPTWRQELEYQKEAILTAFNARLAESGYPKAERPTQCRLLNAGGIGPATRSAKGAKRRG